MHGRLDRHARPQQMLRVLVVIEPNSHREPLHHFHVVPGGIFWGKQTKQRAGGPGKALDFTLVVVPKGVHTNGDRLSRSHPFELRLLEVGRDPDIVQRNDYEQALSWLYAMTELNSLSSDHAADRRVDFRVTEIELSGVQVSTGLFLVP